MHRELSTGKWAQMNFMEQLANVGSEVSRASRWKMKNNEIRYFYPFAFAARKNL